MIHSLKILSSSVPCVNKFNSFDKTISFLSSFLKNITNQHLYQIQKEVRKKINPYVAGSSESTTQLIKRFIHIHGLEDVENGFSFNAAFDLTIKAFLKLLLFQSVGVVNLSKTSLGNFTMSSEYLS